MHPIVRGVILGMVIAASATIENTVTGMNDGVTVGGGACQSTAIVDLVGTGITSAADVRLTIDIVVAMMATTGHVTGVAVNAAITHPDRIVIPILRHRGQCQ